ncbi:hypothetical protein [Gimesia aquarii]|uniref:Uncharacterized protein n=1 Tax=Gimesia aquarii TaxID=2527964 RepID=A0A517WN47_9PLAN|nr:hypothetical protein [Gimesia aquarii]QDU06670.1 hypothetical protein V202x_00130 [Gimesia aquarii]
MTKNIKIITGSHVAVYTSFPCRIDVTWLVMELMVVLAATTMLAFFLNLRSGRQKEL